MKDVLFQMNLSSGRYQKTAERTPMGQNFLLLGTKDTLCRPGI